MKFKVGDITNDGRNLFLIVKIKEQLVRYYWINGNITIGDECLNNSIIDNFFSDSLYTDIFREAL